MRGSIEPADYKRYVLPLPRIFAGSNIDVENLRGLINLFSKPIFAEEHNGTDLIGRVYEYLFPHQPYSKIVFVVKAAGTAKRQTAAEYLGMLEELGILRSEMLGRERILVNVPLMNLLTEETS